MRAVLENNLVEAFGRADETNAARMRDWATWLFNEAPSTCWGSPEKVQAWLAEGFDAPVGAGEEACRLCGAEPSDPHNGEIHAAEAVAPVYHP
jgi:hypothetical protein